MTEMVAHVFECGHEGTEVVKKKKQLVCPECGARMTQKKYKCQNCGKIFYDSKNGSHSYCKDCAAKIKQATHLAWLKRYKKEPKQKRGPNTKPVEKVHDRVDCIHRRKCLMNRITRNPDVCLTCDEYKSEFNNKERYLHPTGACSTSSNLSNGIRALK